MRGRGKMDIRQSSKENNLRHAFRTSFSRIVTLPMRSVNSKWFLSRMNPKNGRRKRMVMLKDCHLNSLDRAVRAQLNFDKIISISMTSSSIGSEIRSLLKRDVAGTTTFYSNHICISSGVRAWRPHIRLEKSQKIVSTRREFSLSLRLDKGEPITRMRRQKSHHLTFVQCKNHASHVTWRKEWKIRCWMWMTS